MKKYLALTLILCAALVLFGCQQTATDTGGTTSTDTTTSATTDSNTDNETTGTDSGSSAATPSDSDVAGAFEGAYIVYQWFDLDPLTVETDADGNVNFYTVGDNAYLGKVDDSRVSSMDDLKSQLKNYFSADVYNALLNDGRYVEDNGVLYEVLADRGADITVGDTLSKKVTARSAASITFTVTVETLDGSGEASGSKNVDYLYEKVDGNWVFTSFQSLN